MSEKHNIPADEIAGFISQHGKQKANKAALFISHIDNLFNINIPEGCKSVVISHEKAAAINIRSANDDV